jgi:ribosomal protein L37E
MNTGDIESGTAPSAIFKHRLHDKSIHRKSYSCASIGFGRSHHRNREQQKSDE